MNRLGKLALALAAGAAAATIYRRRKKLSEELEKFTTPDGEKYGKDQTYRSSDGELYRNGHRLHTDRGHVAPHDHQPGNNHHDDARLHSNQNLNQNQNVQYHPRGHRHR
ncbi:hypothetical protein ASG01_03155 [Chryseobacterium sp. Leaf180]|uniref:hypothetical protein n=1 Tax=Chryseobacterium sp. Leaf180 TaxID=1736289 RepID=UPI0006FCBBF0|nr:hypothetical protein [Chryseobacterium sp. Leaf180]KQR94877.1 hypothetical protein ASG01_03155 [Chryseobacterium sp. Leaf180]